MPAIKELEIKKVKVKRTEDIKVRVLALEQDNYIIDTDNFSTLQDIIIWRGDHNQKNIMLAGDEKGTLESIRANVIQ
ncbi:hypothetical protein [Paenibacillus polymyxa]|uniref:hypothetical protein n=1 Tax=Paenibacillus polymyxa TaxID=1406 RepID=UPI0004DEFB71|nr:hypothetical protein [Paenibacillus polymyxa]MBY7737471.1 cytochrome P450 [Paenibacillus polymyxa]